MASLKTGRIYQGDCVKKLSEVPAGSVDLAFADPPFNIGYEYDVYQDRRQAEEYLAWCRKWMAGVVKALKPTGTFWLAIGDEFAAELKVVAQQDLGLSCRSWVIWYYTFGVNCVRNFTRSHTHLFYFVKDPEQFTFHADDPAIRVPSARQLVYADKRANPHGRLPDNTWILRPQDVEQGFLSEQDTWYFSRVAGTFKERAGFHGCQMPEQLLGRIIRACSSPGETVLDPFSGSGTTLVVAKKLGRKWLGFELSPQYAEKASARVAAAEDGHLLVGPADPVRSAPATPTQPAVNSHNSRHTPGAAADRTLSVPATMNGYAAKRAPTRADTPTHPVTPVVPAVKRADRNTVARAEIERGVIDAFKQVHGGCSVDRLLADVEIDAAFIDACRGKGLAGTAAVWNRTLIGLRKSKRVPRCGSHTRVFAARDMDHYSFASEIAIAEMSLRNLSLDDILCDPTLAREFDQLAAQYAPNFSSLQYRWAALNLRKRAKERHDCAKNLPPELAKLTLEPPVPWSRMRLNSIEPVPGVYVLFGRKKEALYAGEAFNLRSRFERHSGQQFGSGCSFPLPNRKSIDRCAVQSMLIGRLSPRLNYAELACRSAEKS